MTSTTARASRSRDLLSLCFAAVVLFAAALTEGLPRPVSALLFVAGFAVLVPTLWATREVSA